MPLYKGTAKRIDDIDLPRIGAMIGVGEDPLHALIEVETSGSGFDREGRIKMLFEPHKFYKHLRHDPAKRDQAVRAGLAYRNWGQQKYPKDSYPRFERALEIDPHAAWLSASWGMGQIMGENYALAGYNSVEDMVQAFAEDEDNHLEAMVNFVRSSGIDDDLRRIENKIRRKQSITISDVVPIVRTYNGSGYARNQYDTRFLRALNRWIKIKDTPYATNANLKELSKRENEEHEISLIASPPPPVSIDEDDDADVALAPDLKTETVTEKSTEMTAGTPPPAPAQEVKASQPSLMSKLSAISLPGGVTAVIAAIWGFAKNMPPWGWAILGGVFVIAMIIGAWLFNESMKRAQHRTDNLMDAAASQEKNNLRLV